MLKIITNIANKKRINMENYKRELEKSKGSTKMGILLMIMAAFFFALMAFVIKLLDNIPLLEIVLFRNIPSMIIIPIIILIKKNERYNIKCVIRENVNMNNTMEIVDGILILVMSL